MFHLRLLGSPELVRSDGEQVVSVLSQPKRLALLAYLAADPGRQHSRDELIGVFWPESTEGDARNALKQALHYLRRSLAEGVVVSRGDGRIGIDRALLECDVVDFEESVATVDLERALKLYRGDLAEGLYVSGCPEFDHWRDQRSATLRRAAVEAAETLSRRRAEEGDLPVAIDFARRAVELAPSDESHVRSLMRLLAAAGDRAGAITAYEQFERRFQEELGLEPSPETMELLLEIREAPALSSVGATVPSTGEPVLYEPGVDETSLPGFVAGANTSPAVGALPTRPRRIGLAAAVVVAAIVATIVGVTSRTGGRFAADPEPPRLIVLPFENLSDSVDDYFADGVTEEITALLGGLSGLRVIARQTAIQYRGSALSAREIAEELDLDYVLEGTVRTDRLADGSGQARITPQLIRASDETHVWVGRYTVQLLAGDIFRIQAEIAAGVALGLDVAMPRPEPDWVASAGTESAEAYDYYMRGLSYFSRQRRRVEDYRLAADMLERAVATDSEYVEGYALLARTYSELGAWRGFGQADAIPKAKAAAERAIRLGPEHPDANLAMGVYLTSHTDEPEPVERHLQAARRARPRDTYILQRLANIQAAMGDRDAATATRMAALEIDPRSVPILRAVAGSHARAGRYDEAVAVYDRYIELVPDAATPYFWKTLILLYQDGGVERARGVVESAAGRADLVSWMLISWDFDDAFMLRMFADHFDDAIERHVMQDADPVAYYFAKGDVAGRNLGPAEARVYYDSARVVLERRLEDSGDSARTARNLRLVHALLGNAEQARQGVDLITGRVEIAAQVYMLIGDYDRAVDVLEDLQGVRPIVSKSMLRIDPLWDPLRDHPRFQALLASEDH